jgi:tight adherence protein C
MSTVYLVVGIAGIFAALFLCMAAVTLSDNSTRGISKSLAVMQAFSAAPQAMKDELQPSFQDRVLSPLMDRTLGLGRKLTPADFNDRIRHKLEVAGNPRGWTTDRVTSLKFIGFVAALVVGLVATMLFGLSLLPSLAVCMLLSVAGYMGPNMYLYQLGYDRTQLMERALPDALDLLTISVESGLGFDAALAQVARNTEGPLADEFARVLQEMQIGLGRGAAMRALADRTHVPDIRGFVGAMVQADALGIPIAQVLRVQSKEIRTKRRQKAEEAAQKVAIKILIPLIFCILPCLFIAVLGPAGITMFEAFSGRM